MLSDHFLWITLYIYLQFWVNYSLKKFVPIQIQFSFFFSHKMVQHKFDSKTEWFSHFFNTFSFLTLSCTEGILGKFSFFTKSSINKIWLLPFFFMIYQNDHKNIYIYSKKINFPKKNLGERGRATREEEASEKNFFSCLSPNWEKHNL